MWKSAVEMHSGEKHTVEVHSEEKALCIVHSGEKYCGSGENMHFILGLALYCPLIFIKLSVHARGLSAIITP